MDTEVTGLTHEQMQHILIQLLVLQYSDDVHACIVNIKNTPKFKEVSNEKTSDAITNGIVNRDNIEKRGGTKNGVASCSGCLGEHTGDMLAASICKQLPPCLVGSTAEGTNSMHIWVQKVPPQGNKTLCIHCGGDGFTRDAGVKIPCICI
jgi:hypothetical protein